MLPGARGCFSSPWSTVDMTTEEPTAPAEAPEIKLTMLDALFAEFALEQSERTLGEMAAGPQEDMDPDELGHTMMDVVNATIILRTPLPDGLERQIRQLLVLGARARRNGADLPTW